MTLYDSCSLTFISGTIFQLKYGLYILGYLIVSSFLYLTVWIHSISNNSILDVIYVGTRTSCFSDLIYSHISHDYM